MDAAVDLILPNRRSAALGLHTFWLLGMSIFEKKNRQFSKETDVDAVSASIRSWFTSRNSINLISHSHSPSRWIIRECVRHICMRHRNATWPKTQTMLSLQNDLCKLTENIWKWFYHEIVVRSWGDRVLIGVCVCVCVCSYCFPLSQWLGCARAYSTSLFLL